jgi:3-dehydroquinate synthase
MEWLRRAVPSPGRIVTLPAGEAHKTLGTVSRIWDEALAAGVDRRAVVVAFGGGVVGDLAGFAAATLLRGVRCVQVPTTLLSMVDSSVGGKTGFDHPAGKNLLGAFFQPEHVLVDLDHLSTLSSRERACGLAEIVKIALVRDASLLELLERRAADIARGDHDVMRDVVRRAIHAKIRVVREDERESGPRALLNLGHTVGHALEAHAQYTNLLHGEAVAVGTVAEIAACERIGISPRGAAESARALLASFALPTTVDTTTLAAAWPFVMSDKKRAADTLSVPVVTGRGEAHVQRMSLVDFRRALLG